MSVRGSKTTHIAGAIKREIGRIEVEKFYRYYNAIIDQRTKVLTTVALKRHLLSIPKLPVTAEELKHMIIQVDLDGNGVIDRDEFVIIMYQSNLDSFLWKTSHKKYSPLLEAKTCKAKLEVTLNDARSSAGAMCLAVTIFFFIGLSSTCLCFQTLLLVRDCEECTMFFLLVDYVSTVVFTAEFVARIMIAKSVREVFTDALMYCDFLSIVPVYIELVLLNALDDPSSVEESPYLNVLRVFRLFRLLKLSRYVPFMRTIGVTFFKSIVPFAMTLFIVVIYAFIAAALMFFFERGTWSEQHHTWVRDDGEKLEFESIIDWVFWVFYTILTVGYGQVDVKGGSGQVVGCITAMFGTIVLAVPISIFSSNFNSENQITEAEQIVAFDRETKRILALARKEEAEREANEAKRRAKLQHSIVEVKDDPSATAPRSEDALETKSHSSEVGKKSSAQQLGLASLRVKTGSGVASPTSNRGDGDSPIMGKRGKRAGPASVVGSHDQLRQHFSDPEAAGMLSVDERALTTSFVKSPSGSLIAISPVSGTRTRAEDHHHPQVSSSHASARSPGAPGTRLKSRVRLPQRKGSLDEDFKLRTVGKTAKERKRMRSFTTSGTVTDIIAQMEIEEGDPLIHQISRIVRTHERRLKSKISKRHAQFLQSVQEEIENVIHGVFTVQVGAPSKTKQGQRLITLGVAEEGLTDDHTQKSMSSVHQMDSILNLSGHKNNESMNSKWNPTLLCCSMSQRCTVRHLFVLSHISLDA
eukprot:INCI9977.2.p1 GENE.INCI9977.2~~INCI9977.2.p1  ORF type:complete len:754 (+),score=126.75 INCI9977.2:247-2508(+)